jgi:hypothetical protein
MLSSPKVYLKASHVTIFPLPKQLHQLEMVLKANGYPGDDPVLLSGLLLWERLGGGFDGLILEGLGRLPVGVGRSEEVRL